jgi:hypothetical protein
MTVNKELLKSTLKLIEENVEHWSQPAWHCGTSHCFAGFVELQIKGLPLDTPAGHEELEPEDPESEGETETIAVEALGIEPEQADELFDPGNSLEDLRKIVSHLVS